MSTLIPSLAARFDARGELNLTERLKDSLEDSARAWHNISSWPFGRHPDFVALHPQQCSVMPEVSDWQLDRIETGSPNPEPTYSGLFPCVIFITDSRQ